MVSINQLTVDFGGFRLFEEISFLISPRDRIGLVGKNGAGKSTLLKIISGQSVPTEGNVALPKDLIIGYLPQHLDYSDTQTVREETELAFSDLKKLELEIKNLSTQINKRSDFDSPEYYRLIELLTEKSDLFSVLGGNNYHSQIELTLKGLGFKRSDLDRLTAEFSGGWRMRIELAKILLKKPGIFLLDEPTNHLDIESIQWLEDYLKNYSGAVILISHDKAFLDNITTRTVEISMGRIYDYKASYSHFISLRNERREQQLAAYRNQQKKIEDTEEFIERFRYKSTKAIQVQSRIKQLEKIDRIEVDEFDQSTIKIKFPPAPHSGAVTVKGDEISKSYGSLKVFENIDFSINRGEKIAFVGKNGEGKTTLARIIMDEIEYNGRIQLGYQVKIGYFAQNQADKLNNNLTVLETVDQVAAGEVRTKIRDLLGAFLFSGDAVDKKVSVLSGGERTRLAMVLLLLEPVNFLILDEPTNHLDMRSKEILKKALTDFEGTILLVSHDREFLDGMVNRIIEFGNRKIKEHLCGIYEFLQKKRMESLNELEKEEKTLIDSQNKTSDNKGKTNFEERKELNKQIKKLTLDVESAENEINILEERQKELDVILQNNSGLIIEDSVFKDYEKLQYNLKDKLKLWEILHEKLEELEQQKKTLDLS